MIRWVAALILAATPLLAEVPEPVEYRGEPYRAPVPETLAGAEVIDAERAIELQADGVAFIDVLPRTRKPDKLPEDMVWREPRHDTIPGAVWLWNTGYQELSVAEQARLQSGLEQVTGGDQSAPVVIFCRADCWMSWNAAKRAVSMGYSQIFWFPGGTDDWQATMGPDLVKARPVAP